MRTHREIRRNCPLQVESLESMTLLSSIPAMGLPLGPALVQKQAATPVAFNATTRGLFFTTQSNPDTGTTYHVFTIGRNSGGVLVGVSGDLVTPGFIRGRTTGTLTVFTARGSLTLDVTGPVQNGPAPLPSTLGYTITGGTGAFANNHSGSGTIAVSYHVNHTGTGHALSDFTQSGTISLRFRGGSSVV